MNIKLYRSKTQKMVGGVCGGLAEMFGIDVSIIRILVAISMLFFGTGFILYLIAWLVIPEAPF